MTITIDALGLSARAQRTEDSPISWLMQLTIADPGILSLAAGFVDRETLPEDLLRAAAARVFATPDSGKDALQYGATAGLRRLRNALAARLESQGLEGADPNRLVITNGGQQSLSIITDVLVDPGDVVLVEDPTYFVYMDVMKAVGAHAVGVATDDEGMIPAALEQRLAELRAEGLRDRLKILYLISYFQNPKGSNMSAARRRALVEIVERELADGPRFLLLEDACYRDLRIDGADEPFLRSLLPADAPAALLGTFSKAFSPGLRLGWSYLPEELLRHVLRQKGSQDFGTSNMNQHIMAELLEGGEYEEAAARFRARYRVKRDALVEAIRAHWPADVEIVHPKGGLYVWARVPGLNTDPETPFFNACLESKVIYVPGYYCYGENPQEPRPNDAMRLCYGVIGLEPMREAVRRMGAAMEDLRR